MNTEYVTDTDQIREAIAGEVIINSKQVLVVEADHKRVSKQVYKVLAEYPEYAVQIGKGLVRKNSGKQWNRPSGNEVKAIVLDRFILAKKEVGEGGRVRLKLNVPLHNFTIPTILQSRWLDKEALSFFRNVKVPVMGTVVKNP
jgi:RNase P/RNase MRP subunit p29